MIALCSFARGSVRVYVLRPRGGLYCVSIKYQVQYTKVTQNNNARCLWFAIRFLSHSLHTCVCCTCSLHTNARIVLSSLLHHMRTLNESDPPGMHSFTLTPQTCICGPVKLSSASAHSGPSLCRARWQLLDQSTCSAFAFSVRILICSSRIALCADKRSIFLTSAESLPFGDPLLKLPSECCSDAADDEGCPDTCMRISTSNDASSDVRAISDVIAISDALALSPDFLASSRVAVVPMSASRILVPSVSEMHTKFTSSSPVDRRTYLWGGGM